MTEIRYRSAITGGYVSEAFAKANPDTTIRETERQADQRQVEQMRADNERRASTPDEPVDADWEGMKL